MSETTLDRAERLESVRPEDMQFDDLIAFVEDYLVAYEEPHNYFSGHNRMAALTREVLARFKDARQPA